MLLCNATGIVLEGTGAVLKATGAVCRLQVFFWGVTGARLEASRAALKALESHGRYSQAVLWRLQALFCKAQALFWRLQARLWMPQRSRWRLQALFWRAHALFWTKGASQEATGVVLGDH